MSMLDIEEESRLAQRLDKLEREMKALDDRDDILMKRSYENPQEADDRMVQHRNLYGEHDLYLALRERPEIFGEYPQDRARFDEAYNARKRLPETFGDYMKRRDEADEIRYTLDRIRRERSEPNRDDLVPER